MRFVCHNSRGMSDTRCRLRMYALSELNTKLVLFALRRRTEKVIYDYHGSASGTCEDVYTKMEHGSRGECEIQFPDIDVFAARDIMQSIMDAWSEIGKSTRVLVDFGGKLEYIRSSLPEALALLNEWGSDGEGEEEKEG